MEPAERCQGLSKSSRSILVLWEKCSSYTFMTVGDQCEELIDVTTLMTPNYDIL